MERVIFCVLVIAFGCVSSETVEFKECGGYDKITPSKVELTPCLKNPCEFHHGQTVDVKITFTAPQNETHLKASIHGIVFGIPINWPMPNADGCNEQGIACPIVKGNEYTYHASFPVLSYYPKIRLTVMWQLDGDVNQFCFKFPMAIVDGAAGEETITG